MEQEKNIYEEDLYSVWLKYSNQPAVLDRVLRENFTMWCKKNPISILEMGCGPGNVARQLFQILDEKNISYSYTGVDPYQEQLDRWGELALNDHVELRKSTIEDFETDNSYDFVLALHCLYYVNDLRASLQKVCSAGKTKLIVHHGEAGINQIQEAFREYVKDGPNIISTYQKIEEELDSLGIKYDLQNVHAQVDIRPCHDPKNPDGIRLIKFFLEHSELPQKVIEEVSNFLKTKGDFLGLDHGYFFIEA